MLLSNIALANENIVSINSPITTQTALKFAPNEVIIGLKEGQIDSNTFENLLKQFLGENRYSTTKYQTLSAIHIKSDDFNTSN